MDLDESGLQAMEELSVSQVHFGVRGETISQVAGSQVTDYLIMASESLFASLSPAGNKLGVQYGVRGKADQACNLRPRFDAQVASFDASRLDAPSLWRAFGRHARFHSCLFL
ncbi:MULTISPECIES: hypothetical protein [unclassified Actinoplanes]|uniref:hypothetical protein n=1 Tax=unclassified Actinoplanes TaxID=2626549 RepID=UPI0012BB08CF|nr:MULTISPECIES: hypothetical protein [unclassified Actinoplanes]